MTETTAKIRAFLASRDIAVSEDDGLTSNEIQEFWGIMFTEFAVSHQTAAASLHFLDVLPDAAVKAIEGAADGVVASEEKETEPVAAPESASVETTAPVTEPVSEQVAESAAATEETPEETAEEVPADESVEEDSEQESAPDKE